MAAEGENEIDARMSAAIDATPLPDGAFLHSQMPFCVQQNEVPSLTAVDAFDRLRAHADEASATMRERFNGDLALIVIDTLAAAASFGDENSASETQAVMNVLHRLSKHTKALVLVIDHHGKVAETGVRGSSAKSGAADAILAVLADKAFEGTITNRRLAIVKLRGGPTGAVMPFSLRGVPLSDGDATTCVVEWGGETLKIVTIKAERSPWTGKSRILKRAIEVALIERGEDLQPFGGEGPRVMAVKREKVRIEFYASLPADGDGEIKQETKRRTFSRLADEAIAKELIASRVLVKVKVDG